MGVNRPQYPPKSPDSSVKIRSHFI